MDRVESNYFDTSAPTSGRKLLQAVGAAFAMAPRRACAKPLTRTIHESRRPAQLARETGVATQMSAQSCGSDASLSTVEWVQVGAVREVHVWTDRPVWPQAMARPAAEPVPESLDGPAEVRPTTECPPRCASYFVAGP